MHSPRLERAFDRIRVGAVAASTLGGGLALFVPSMSAFAQGDTVRVSVDSAGAEANDVSEYPAVSSDGRFVAFVSVASNLVPGDTNRQADAFVHDRATGTTERMSVDSSGAEANGSSGMPEISADGRFVLFNSSAPNLDPNDTNGVIDVFVHDRATGVTERVSLDSFGGQGDKFSTFGTISRNGQVVAFVSDATNLVPGDTNGVFDVFVRDLTTGISERVSVDSFGAEGDGFSLSAALSADGQVVAFGSYSTNLVPGDTNGLPDVFVHDRTTGVTERVSVSTVGGEGDWSSSIPSISADGRIVSFWSGASNLVAGDVNGFGDIFVRDRNAGITELASVDSSGVQGDLACFESVISADGRFVLFDSDSTNLVAGDTNASRDLFLHDRSTGATERVSVDSSGGEGNGPSYVGPISEVGQVIALTSWAKNLVANDTNGTSDIFVREVCYIDASWSNYGAGFPGTNGVPSFTSQSNPILGSSVTLNLANSYAQPTVGLLFIGFQRTTIPTRLGGDLLVVPALTSFETFSFGGNAYTGTIPDGSGLCGIAIDLQAIEADPGAAKGVSFTAGLELVLGR